MFDLIKMYLFRLVKSKLFWIFLGIAAASTALDSLVYGVSGKIVNDNAAGVVSTYFVLSTQSLSSFIFTNIPAIIGPAFCFFFFTQEFHDGTIRNMILSGKKRSEIFFSALIVAFIVCYVNVLLIQAFVWGIGPLFGLASGLADGAAVLRFFGSMGLLFVMSLMFAGLAVGLCFLVPNAFGSFGIYIGFVLLLVIVYGLSSVAFSSLVSSGAIDQNVADVFTRGSTTAQIVYYEQYPLTDQTAVTSLFMDYAYWTIGESVVIGGGALVGGALKFIKSDLK